MPQSISEQASLLVQNMDILCDSTQRLDDKFRSKIEKMCQKMYDFFNEYHFHVNLPTHEYTSYLNHDALSPLTVVLGYAELFRSVNAHLLTNDELDHVTIICNQIRYLTESIRSERDVLIGKRDGYTSTNT